MTTNKAVLGEGSITHLIGAQDEDIGNPKPNVKTGQALQIELARETVRDMQRHMRVGKAGIQLMTGKTPVGSIPVPIVGGFQDPQGHCFIIREGAELTYCRSSY